MFYRLLEYIKDWWLGKPLGGGLRSSQWGKLSRQFLKENPYCFCGEKAKTTHHIIPFSVDSSKELLKENLFAVCNHCHLRFAHLGSFRSYNKNIREDAEVWRQKISQRPK
ncbi:MAG: HNH endonuclease signature motif containing protein [Nanoarchaeota archaeon]